MDIEQKKLLAASAKGVVTAPHYLATQAGVEVLQEGGNAIEAALVVGTVLTVVYPHMNSLGGDAFFLIADADGRTIGLDGAGPAGVHYSIDAYRSRGFDAIPKRGPLAANTVAGVVALWGDAWELSRKDWDGKFGWAQLLERAMAHAENGVPLTSGQIRSIRDHWAQLSQTKNFRDTFLIDGEVPVPGKTFRQPALAESYRTLMAEGADSFYRGSLAKKIVAGLAAEGSLLTLEDFARYRCRRVKPITVPFYRGRVANMPPPSVGLVAHIILGLLDRMDLSCVQPGSAEYIHLQVEATKLAYQLRDRYLGDPDFVDVPVDRFLSPDFLDELSARIDAKRAMPFDNGGGPGDTVWFGVMDEKGRTVSAIQSICWEYGSGIVAGDTGIVWHNRGHGFSLDEKAANAIRPGKRPAHTLSAPIYMEDGRAKLVYGTMGGEAQPQTQAIIATGALTYNRPLDEIMNAPRWVLGRAWGDMSPTTLKLEARFDQSIFDRLTALGHECEWLAPYDTFTGHAGVIRVGEDGVMEAASDPRSDGSAAGV